MGDCLLAASARGVKLEDETKRLRGVQPTQPPAPSIHRGIQTRPPEKQSKTMFGTLPHRGKRFTSREPRFVNATAQSQWPLPLSFGYAALTSARPISQLAGIALVRVIAIYSSCSTVPAIPTCSPLSQMTSSSLLRPAGSRLVVEAWLPQCDKWRQAAVSVKDCKTPFARQVQEHGSETRAWADLCHRAISLPRCGELSCNALRIYKCSDRETRKPLKRWEDGGCWQHSVCAK